MIEKLIPTIENITKYGLRQNLIIENKESNLEEDLVKIYSLYFQIKFEPDDTDYPDYNRANYSDIRQTVCSNFPDYGLYKTYLDINDVKNTGDTAIGDAIDDLTDIIKDLLEIKWRIENNSLEDGLWFFEHLFWTHTQQHILDLLNYMKQKNR